MGGLFSLILLIGAMGWNILAELRGLREEHRRYQIEVLKIEQARIRQGSHLVEALIEIVQHMEWKEGADESV